jgi:hypothetical protein
MLYFASNADSYLYFLTLNLDRIGSVCILIKRPILYHSPIGFTNARD